MRVLKGFLLSLAGLALCAVPASGQALGTTARQLPPGSLKVLAFYQGIQEQAVNFNVGSPGVCTAKAGAPAPTFGCNQSGNVSGKGHGGAGLVKVVYQPWEILQYYAAFGAGDYGLDVPSTTMTNSLTGDNPGAIMTFGAKAVLYPDTMVTPAIAVDLSLSRSRYAFNRMFPGGTPGVSGNVNKRLDLMQYQVAVEASHVFTVRDADEKAAEKEGLVALRSQGFKLEPYGGAKWLRIQSDLKDLDDGSHVGGQQDTVTPFLGLRIPFAKNEGFFAEAQFVDGYVYAAGLDIRFR